MSTYETILKLKQIKTKPRWNPLLLCIFRWIILMKIVSKEFPLLWKNIDHLFRMANEIIEADRLHLFLLSGCTRIDNNDYLSSLENGTKLTVCTEEQIQKLSIYFELKRYLGFKNISYPLDIDSFI